MNPNRRNLIVGIVVFGALLVLGWMIIQFGAQVARPFSPEQLAIDVTADRADGLADGSPVNYRGVTIGRVTSVRVADDASRVLIQAALDNKGLPANVVGSIFKTSAIGAAASLDLDVPPGVKPEGRIQSGAKLTAHYVGLALLPPEFSELATELRKTATQFRESNLIGNLNEQVRKIGQTADNLNAVLGDPAVKTDLRTTAENLRKATESAAGVAAKLDKFSDELADVAKGTNETIGQAKTLLTRTDERLDVLTRQLSARMEQASKLLDSIN
ncbi:MAG TPA: MlaD family protein, partial [Tepidisphaeraceae bacterium]|nr:MlaD family protein [Tepidisphaeraceae bacterium]